MAPDLRTVRQAVDTAVMPRLKAIYVRVLAEYAADLSAAADDGATVESSSSPVSGRRNSIRHRNRKVSIRISATSPARFAA